MLNEHQRVNMIPGWTKVGVPTIGQCKGTLEALMVADMILIFHIPLFAAWLKKVMNNVLKSYALKMEIYLSALFGKISYV